jgi:hypothetical protein
VNDQLRRGRPFFVDINRDGIIVYEFEPKALAKPGNLSAEEIREEARGHFEQWFQRSLDFSITAAFNVSKNMTNLAAFNLHQSVESAYHCVLLTLTLYSPQRRPFDRIRRAYVEARYSKHYRITKETLAEATGSVEMLQGIVKVVCEERFANSYYVPGIL